MAQAVQERQELKRFQITIEVHGHAYVITKEAPTYYDMVNEINNQFGNVMILETIDLD